MLNCNAAANTHTVETLYSGHLGTKKGCPDYQDVLISGLEDVLLQSMENNLVPFSVCP